MKDIPNHLQKTYKLITSSFPQGIKQNEYEILIYILYEHMSDRNLSDILSIITNKDIIIVSNDIPQYCSDHNLNHDMTNEVMTKLNEHGFQEWIKED